MTTPTSSDSQIDLSPDGPVPTDPEATQPSDDDESPPAPPNGSSGDSDNGDTSPALNKPEEPEPSPEPEAETPAEPEPEADVPPEPEAESPVDSEPEEADGTETPEDTETPDDTKAPDADEDAETSGVVADAETDPAADVDAIDHTAVDAIDHTDSAEASDDGDEVRGSGEPRRSDGEAVEPGETDEVVLVSTDVAEAETGPKAPIGVPVRSDMGGGPVRPGRASAPLGFPPSLMDEMRAAERSDPTTLGAFDEPTAEHPAIRIDELPPDARLPSSPPMPVETPGEQEPVADDEAPTTTGTTGEQVRPHRSDNGEVTGPARPDVAEPAPNEPVVKPPVRELPVLPEHLTSPRPPSVAAEPRRPPVVEELRWADEDAPLPATEPAQEAEPVPEGPEVEEQREVEPALGGLELRQVAGLTAGSVLELTEPSYAFAQGKDQVGFTINVDTDEQVVVVPGAVAATIDTAPVTEPTVLGSDVLDVGTARFLVVARRQRKRATDWLDLEANVDVPPPPVHVPPELTDDSYRESEQHKRRLFGRRSTKQNRLDPEMLGAIGWDLVETVRTARAIAADRERYLYPDPAELAVRVANRAPILGLRNRTDPLFATVGVLCADMPWMPQFDDVTAIPSWLSPQLQQLMSLPSIPIAADLRIGPLGIATGSRNAALACARHILLSLYALSGEELRVHVVANDDRAGAWEWARRLTPFKAIDPGHGYPVVIVDGMDSFADAGLSHQDAIENRIGLVVLADDVDGLPPYSGTVLQVDRSGTGRLTNHKGHIITGTPIGVTADYAQRLANDLAALSTPARHPGR